MNLKDIVSLGLIVLALKSYAGIDPKRDWDWSRPNTINLYQYAKNDPINSWDPDGFTEESVEKILRSVDSKLREAHAQGKKAGGHEMAFAIYKKRGKIKTTEFFKAQNRDGGKLNEQIQGEYLGMAHTHHQEHYGQKNLPPSDVDITVISTDPKESVGIVEGETQRYVAESNDPKKAQAFLESLGSDATAKIDIKARTYFTDYKKANPNSSYIDAHNYTLLKIAEHLGVKIYRTEAGGDQTDVTEIKLEKKPPEE